MIVDAFDVEVNWEIAGMIGRYLDRGSHYYATIGLNDFWIWVSWAVDPPHKTNTPLDPAHLVVVFPKSREEIKISPSLWIPW